MEPLTRTLRYGQVSTLSKYLTDLDVRVLSRWDLAIPPLTFFEPRCRSAWSTQNLLTGEQIRSYCQGQVGQQLLSAR